MTREEIVSTYKSLLGRLLLVKEFDWHIPSGRGGAHKGISLVRAKPTPEDDLFYHDGNAYTPTLNVSILTPREFDTNHHCWIRLVEGGYEVLGNRAEHDQAICCEGVTRE